MNRVTAIRWWIGLLGVLSATTAWSALQYSAARERARQSAATMRETSRLVAQLAGVDVDAPTATVLDARQQLGDLFRQAGVEETQVVRLQPTLGRAASAGGAAPHVTEALLENVTMEQIARVLVSMADQRLRATHLRLTASRQRQTPERWRIELTTVTGPSGASGEARP